jgi:hypothetical protein
MHCMDFGMFFSKLDSTRFALAISLGFVFVCNFCDNLQGQETRDFFRKVIDARKAIASVEFEASVYRRKFVHPSQESKELEGGRFEYVFHWSLGDSRVDCIEIRPLALEKETAFRYSKKDGSLRVFDDDKVDVLVTELLGPQIAVAENFTVERLSIDPRYIGFWPAMFEELRSFSLKEITSLTEPDHGLQFPWTVEETRAGKSILFHASDPDSDLNWDFEFSQKWSVPVRVTLRGFSGKYVVDELVTEWEGVDGIAFPVKATFVKTENGIEKIVEEWMFRPTTMNVPLDANLHSWESLRLKEDAVVMQLSPTVKRYSQWRQGKFVEWVPTPLMEKVGVPPSSRRFAVVVFGLILLIAGIGIAFRVLAVSRK